MTDDPKSKWVARLCEFLPGFLDAHPVLGAFASSGDAVLHGSTTFGFDDDVSDLDLWLLLPEAELAEVDAAGGTRFFGFQVDGKEAHINAESAEGFAAEVDGCEMIRIAELRQAEPILTNMGVSEGLIDRVRQPMREEVRRGMLCFHYVEMRGFHRNCDNPMFRGDSAAVLLTLSLTLTETLRCALLIDGEPYPYEKWLRFAAARTPTGIRIIERIDALVDHLSPELLRRAGPEADHPINLALHEMRDVLIEAARASGIDEPWLQLWYLHMAQAREVREQLRW